MHLLEPGSIVNIKKRKQPQRSLEDVLKSIGKCCNVDHCTGVIRHYDPEGGNIATYAIRSGAFVRESVQKAPRPTPKWKISGDAIRNLKGVRPEFMEEILDDQSHCCGADCCGPNMIRLPEQGSGDVYEFGTKNGADTTPTKTDKRSTHIKRYQTPPMTLTKRGKPVKFLEDAQECIRYGFHCCAGMLVLPDLDAPGTVYGLRIVNGAFDYVNLSGTAAPTPPTPPPPQPTPPTATVNQAGGQATGQVVMTFDGTFPAATVVTLQIDFGTGATPVTYTVPAGGETADQVVTGIAALPIWNTNNIGTKASGPTLTLTDNTGNDLEITGGDIGGTAIPMPPPPPIATVTKTGGQAGDQAEMRFENDFPAGTLITLQMKFNGGAVTPVTYTVSAGGQTAGQVAAGIAGLPVWQANDILPVGVPTSATEGALRLTPDPVETIEITGGTIGGTPFSVPAPPPTAGGTVVVTGSPTATSGDTIQITFSGVFQAGQTVNVAIDFTGAGTPMQKVWTATGGETADQAAAAVAGLAWAGYAHALSVAANVITVDPFIDPATATVTVT